MDVLEIRKASRRERRTHERQKRSMGVCVQARAAFQDDAEKITFPSAGAAAVFMGDASQLHK